MRSLLLLMLITSLLALGCGKKEEVAVKGEGTDSAAAQPGQQPDELRIPEDTKLVTTESGLAYSILKEGEEGPHPGLSDTLTVHYTGWSESGEVLDSSVRRGPPVDCTRLTVMPGWREGLELMTPGSRFKFTIPSRLAFGEKGRPPRIPPKETLIYEIELISVKKGPPVPEFRDARPEAQKTTESGLVYEPLTEGSGSSPDEGDAVAVKFTLWTVDGEIVSTNELPGNRGFELRAGEAPLPFLNEGIMLLKEGARARFVVPPELAYGDSGAPPYIPPSSRTIWELELTQVVKPLPVPEFSLSPEDKLLATESGLKYEVIREGTGKSPVMGQKVTVHYAGWLVDGTPFDNSYERGQRATFALGRVIPGWNEGLQLMKEGALYKFTIPPDLAYGERGAPPRIPPNSTLIFVVELFEVGE